MPERGSEAARVRTELEQAGILLVGESATFRIMLAQVNRLAISEATVLIEGETGTGKELAARAIHYLGQRRAQPFIAVNCGALPEALVENELFGHGRGAFTDARERKEGLVELADRGTLFLDEVDSLPMRAQVALLRFLQDRRYRPLGARDECAADVRVLAASNGNLQDRVRGGQFRRDLYYRLHLLTLTVPPLRARPGDAALLAGRFAADLSARYRRPSRPISSRAREWMSHYDWPGNVRELENLVHRDILLGDDDELDLDTRRGESGRLALDVVANDPSPSRYRTAKAEALSQFHRQYLASLLKRAHGNVTVASQLAGKERRSFGRLLKRYGIEPHRESPPPTDGERVTFDPPMR
jgi:DNA-binding NtrC family response regulator